MVEFTEDEINEAYKRVTESYCNHKILDDYYITLEDVIKANNNMIKKYKNREIFKKFCKKLYKHKNKF